MFDTVAEASQKLRNTVVLQNGLPLKVIDACGGDGFTKVKLSTVEYGDQSQKATAILCNSAGLDLGKELGSRCGYANINHKNFGLIAYTSRAPIRKSHSTQGLNDCNVRVSPTKSFSKWGLSNHRYQFSSMEFIGMKDTLMGKFPTLAMARYRMGKTESLLELAFDKNFAVSRDSKDMWKLMYKNQEIGWTDDLSRFHIPSEWRYLDETFEILDMKVRS